MRTFTVEEVALKTGLTQEQVNHYVSIGRFKVVNTPDGPRIVREIDLAAVKKVEVFSSGEAPTV